MKYCEIPPFLEDFATLRISCNFSPQIMEITTEIARLDLIIFNHMEVSIVMGDPPARWMVSVRENPIVRSG